MKTVLVTGSEGFLGKNLKASLNAREDIRVLGIDVQDDPSLLDDFLNQSDFVFHLAGVNRPNDESEFNVGNTELTKKICDYLCNSERQIEIVMSSSVQAILDNPYGVSKRKAEDIVFDYSRRMSVPVYVYRLPNVFGKWCRPNYNSVVATFCHNVANDLPIHVNDEKLQMSLVYVDDVVKSFVAAMDGETSATGDFCDIKPVFTMALGDILALIQSFKASRSDKSVPNMSVPFTKCLYSTYISYLPVDQFSYSLKMNVDDRGSFTEFFRSVDRGQVSINITKPGITKGNHWHHTKTEKFLVVSGQATILFRNMAGGEIIEYRVSDTDLEVVDIPTGYTHNITNTGESDLVTVIWCNELLDPEEPDTYVESV